MLHSNPTVFVVDEDASIREALEGLIRHQGWSAETFATAQEFLSRPRTFEPCCLILDVALPDVSGLDLQIQISASHTDMPIIFITGFSDVPTTVKAMKAGAFEFLVKPFSDEPLIEAVRAALDQSHMAFRLEEEMRDLRQRYAQLSRREREVMTLVVKGLLNKQVGGELGISEITVKAHRGRMMQKMRARTFAELVTIAARLGPDTLLPVHPVQLECAV